MILTNLSMNWRMKMATEERMMGMVAMHSKCTKLENYLGYLGNGCIEIKFFPFQKR